MDETAVVTCFLRNRGEVLLLRRSENVGSYAGQWGAVAGHAEGDPDAAAREEIREETGLDDAVRLVREGDPFPVVDGNLGRRWLVHPYLFDCDRRDAEYNDETATAEWVPPTAILDRETVPQLWNSYDRVRPRVETVESDREHGSAYISLRALEVLRDESALAAKGRHRDDERAERDSDDWAALTALARDLLAARPSMAVVQNRLNRAVSGASADATPGALAQTSQEGIERAVAADEQAAAVAAERLPDRVATLSRSGTALAAIEGADPDSVLVAESRPGREGIEVAERLAASAAVTVTTDAAFAFELAERGVEALVVGADRVLPDGRVVNKVGTRAAALAAAHAGIDVYVVAASDKIATDERIDPEPREDGDVYDGRASLSVANPTFDVTPAEAVDAVLTERGALDAAAVREISGEHRQLAAWDR
ncbi:MAG: NUDIX domain-containing protein [Haloarculaceae archaeon]